MEEVSQPKEKTMEEASRPKEKTMEEASQPKEKTMEEVKGFVRRVLLFKFKAKTAPDHVKKLIKDYSNLVNLVESLKTWHMGKDASIENLHEGFTHVFELTFEDAEGIAAYMVHPAHLKFHERISPHLEKIVVIDYKPTSFHT